MHPIVEKVRASNSSVPREKVEVAAWGIALWVRRISARERLELEALAGQKQTPELNLEVIVRTVALAACDEQGGRVFTSGDDLDTLRDSDPAALQQLFEAAARLNRLTAKAQDQVTESLGSRQGEGSPSA